MKRLRHEMGFAALWVGSVAVFRIWVGRFLACWMHIVGCLALGGDLMHLRAQRFSTARGMFSGFCPFCLTNPKRHSNSSLSSNPTLHTLTTFPSVGQDHRTHTIPTLSPPCSQHPGPRSHPCPETSSAAPPSRSAQRSRSSASS